MLYKTSILKTHIYGESKAAIQQLQTYLIKVVSISATCKTQIKIIARFQVKPVASNFLFLDDYYHKFSSLHILKIDENLFAGKEVFLVTTRNRRFVSNALIITLGILFGVLSSLAWYFGYVLHARDMIPYALAFGVIHFITTAIFRATLGASRSEGHGEFHSSMSLCLRRYSPLVLITSAVFIVFSLVFLATYLPYTARVIMSFIGSISFWTMLFAFMGMIHSMPYRHH